MLRLWGVWGVAVLLVAAGDLVDLVLCEESEVDEPAEQKNRAADVSSGEDAEGRAADDDYDAKPVGRADTTKRPFYYADWDDLDNRPLPEWYDRAKVGFYIHWGIYSVASRSPSLWHDVVVNSNEEAKALLKKSNQDNNYEALAHELTGKQFHPDNWAKLFKKAGARYVVFSSKNLDGFAMFPSKANRTWNSVTTGPQRDVVGAVAKAVRANGLKFGVAYELKEWFNPLYRDDKSAKFKNKSYVDSKVVVELKQLLDDYSPSVLWVNGGNEAPDTYWRAKDLLAKMFNEGAVKDELVVNDRWGADTDCKHGSFYNCKDAFNPGKLYDHKWENFFSIEKDHAAARKSPDQQNLHTVEDLIRQIASTVSCGGNVLIGVGASKNGNINPVFEERLELVGEWLTLNGPAIYDTQPFVYQQDWYEPTIWYTCKVRNGYDGLHPTKALLYSDMSKVEAVYAICLSWPKDDVFKMKGITQMVTDFNTSLKCDMLGHPERPLKWTVSGGVTSVQIPDKLKASLKSQYAWTLRFTEKDAPPTKQRAAPDDDDDDYRREVNGSHVKRKHNKKSRKSKHRSHQDSDDKAQNDDSIPDNRSARRHHKKSKRRYKSHSHKDTVGDDEAASLLNNSSVSKDTPASSPESAPGSAASSRRKNKSMRRSNSEENDTDDIETPTAEVGDDDAASLLNSSSVAEDTPAGASAGAPAAAPAGAPAAAPAAAPAGDDLAHTAAPEAQLSSNSPHKIKFFMIKDYHMRLILETN